MTNILDVKGLRNFHKDSQRFEIESQLHTFRRPIGLCEAFATWFT